MILYFIYETTNLINGKKYRGMHKTSNINDGYLGSGKALKLAIKKYGEQNFSREILEFCDSYNDLIEKEKLYVDSNWISNSNNYNLKTGGQSAGILSNESKIKISETLKRKFASGEIIATIGDKNRGNPPWCKGIKMSDDFKEKCSKSAKKRFIEDDNHPLKIYGNKIPWNKGLKFGSQSEEIKMKKSITLKKVWKAKIHPRKGKPSWNKGTHGAQTAWNKGLQMPKIICPKCGVSVDKLNGKRWHFENCKKNNPSI